MKTLILYKSKQGTTKQYAEWLKESIPDAILESVEYFDVKHLSYFDTIIIGSATYMGDIKARKFLIENWDKLDGKNIYLFAVGLVFNSDEEKAYEMIPEYIRSKMNYIKLPGAIHIEKLNLLEKGIVKIAKPGSEKLTVDKDNLKPILDYVARIKKIKKD